MSEQAWMWVLLGFAAVNFGCVVVNAWLDGPLLLIAFSAFVTALCAFEAGYAKAEDRA